jgi:hypothetical protein
MKTTPPTHHAISQRAHQIWEAEGNPHGRDSAIWLTAEQQLTSQTAARLTAETAAESVVEFHLPSATTEADAVRAALQSPVPPGAKSPVKTPPQLAAAAQVRGTGTSQSITTPATNPTPAQSPAATAAQAEQQKKAARSPLLATHHDAPAKAPPESGKPIWDKPHSS